MEVSTLLRKKRNRDSIKQLELSRCTILSKKYIPSRVGWVVAVDDNVEAVDEICAVDEAVVVVVDKDPVDETVEFSAVDKVAVEEAVVVVTDEVVVDAAAEKEN